MHQLCNSEFFGESPRTFPEPHKDAVGNVCRPAYFLSIVVKTGELISMVPKK